MIMIEEMHNIISRNFLLLPSINQEIPDYFHTGNFILGTKIFHFYLEAGVSLLVQKFCSGKDG